MDIKIECIEIKSRRAHTAAYGGADEHLGFKIYKRSDTDEQGGPYPILYMRR